MFLLVSKMSVLVQKTQDLIVLRDFREADKCHQKEASFRCVYVRDSDVLTKIVRTFGIGLCKP